MNTKRSGELFEHAKKLIPGGVNSPVRAFGSVGGVPRFVERGKGASIWDIDGNRYIDYVLSWGPLILGHAHPAVAEALREAAEHGTSFGMPTTIELDLAQVIIDAMPSIEMIRFVNSGTEATMSALRLARAHTKRDKIIKFAGCYHGHADMLLVQAGSGVATLGLPDSPGVPEGTTADTIVVPYNDLEAVKEVFLAAPGEIAAVIVEPIAANMGFVKGKHEFLNGLQTLCKNNDAVLIFDEVMTGFRAGLGGAQRIYDLDPDLTCLGKVIGGGLPVGAYGGKKEIMQSVAPAGPMYQAGTLSGNPLAMSAGLATLRTLVGSGVFDDVSKKTAKLAEGIATIGKENDIPVQTGHAGTMFGAYFLRRSGVEITDYETAKRHADTDQYMKYFHAMLEQGFYFAPSQFEAGFVSSEHTDDDIENTLRAVEIFVKSERRT
ncbi:MAG: glutamate-1-semialdehyde 2,1-aminomutase [Candidatus Latescibacterota bacterium]|nr:MAG: glutamate-1-semialdehyde 2,1-aminomutase [Candidatus Latescibacterota bacterium]